MLPAFVIHDFTYVVIVYSRYEVGFMDSEMCLFLEIDAYVFN